MGYRHTMRYYSALERKEILFFLNKLFIYLFWAALGLRCCAWAFSSCSERELLFVAEHSSRHVGFNSCGTWAQ